VAEGEVDEAVADTAIPEIEEYWEATLPEVYGEDFEPVEQVIAYGPRGPDVPCGDPPPDYRDIADNAFYCPIGDLIAYDAAGFTDDLVEDFGPFSLVIVLAHEYGHAIQERAGVESDLTIIFEQQADCFAGAFTAWVSDGNSDRLAVSLDDLDQAVAGFVSFRDQIGTAAEAPGAHGSAFDRVGAFQDGYVSGAERCAEYEDEPPAVVDIPLTQADLVTGGNAPFEEEGEGDIFDITYTLLEAYWAEQMPAVFEDEWVPYHPDRVADLDLDMAQLRDLYDTIGDFAVSAVISDRYSVGAQEQLGIREGTVESRLQADCFSGSWSGRVAEDTLNPPPDYTGPVLSAGDLDEGVITFLLLDEEPGEEGSDTGSPFERIQAFRDGFFGGLEACR
jgi:predicted metalloprotease